MAKLISLVLLLITFSAVIQAFLTIEVENELHSTTKIEKESQEIEIPRKLLQKLFIETIVTSFDPEKEFQEIEHPGKLLQRCRPENADCLTGPCCAGLRCVGITATQFRCRRV